MLFNNAGGISMFGKKKDSPIAEGVSMVEQTEVITERLRSPADTAKLEVMHALLDIADSDDLDSIWMTLLTELGGLGYKLTDEPGALLERLKRQF
jgi:hypothetical protein